MFEGWFWEFIKMITLEKQKSELEGGMRGYRWVYGEYEGFRRSAEQLVVIEVIM